MIKAQRVKRGFHSLALLSALVLAGCSSTDPNANIPAPAKTAGSADQALKPTYKATQQTGPEVLMSAGQNNGSYINARRALVRSSLPDPKGIQLSEWVNFFPYDYPQPQGRIPFAASSEMAETPWNPNTKLLRIAIKADDIQTNERKPANLVIFVGTNNVDLSLVKLSLTNLANQLSARDSLAIITSSGENGILLASTAGNNKDKILSAINNLKSGSVGKDSERLAQAYELVKKSYISDSINRVILAGNSNFNAGFKEIQDVKSFFSNGKNTGISLTAVGFAASQFVPSSLADIAYEGNGVYSYIDNERDANKVWAEQLSSTQTPVAKAFSMKVEFNPTYVKAYRLLGYESADGQNSNQTNHDVVVTGQKLTALYEIIPAGSPESWSNEKFGPTFTPSYSSNISKTKELAIAHLRYKMPNSQSQAFPIEFPISEAQMKAQLDKSSKDFRFAAAVAAFAQQLRDNGVTTGQFTLDDTLKLAREGEGSDKFELRGEFIQLIQNAQEVLPKTSPIKGQSSK